MSKQKIFKRSIPIWLVVVLVLVAGVGTSAAMTIGLIPPVHISLFQSQQSASNFNVLSENNQFQGPNKLTVKLTLQNTDVANPHSANVTISILDSSGNELYAEFQLTGTVAASSSIALVFTFSDPGVTASYGSTFVQVTDLS